MKGHYGLWTHISQQFKVEMPYKWICFLRTCGFWLHKTLTDGLEWCGLLGCFISCLDSHSDGTRSLQRTHCWASDAMLHFSKSVPMNKLIHNGWVFSANFHFWTTPLNMLISIFYLLFQSWWSVSDDVTAFKCLFLPLHYSIKTSWSTTHTNTT